MKTYKATIYVGLQSGYDNWEYPIGKAESICKDWVEEFGGCVSFTPTRFIYTDGQENGVAVEFIQYPRFPRDEEVIRDEARALAKRLMLELEQYRVTVVCSDDTYTLTNKKLLT